MIYCGAQQLISAEVGSGHLQNEKVAMCRKVSSHVISDFCTEIK
jgi:hypothetical protein